jgi:hypothetical protein
MRAALILVGLAAFVVMELRTPPRTPKPVHEPLGPTTDGSSVSRDTLDPRDTLTAAGRLGNHHARNEAPLEPISPIEANVPPVQQRPLPLTLVRHKHQSRGRSAAADGSAARLQSAHGSARRRAAEPCGDPPSHQSPFRARSHEPIATQVAWEPARTRCSLRCMSPQLALFGPSSMSELRL